MKQVNVTKRKAIVILIPITHHNLDNNSVDLLKKVEMMKRKAMRAEA